MGKKYLDTKTYTLEASVMDVWENLEEEEQNFEAIVREGMKKLDPVGQADGDIDNDGDEDETDAYLKNRRKAIGRAMKGKKNLKANYGMMRANYGMGEDVDLEEGTKQVLAHGGKGQYKAVRDGGITKIMYKGKVVGTADFDSGADSFFVSMKGVKGQKSFDDAQAMVDYFAKNKITEEVDLDEDIGALIFGGGIIAALLPVLFMSVREIIRGTPLESSIKKIVDKLKKNKNYKMSDSEKSDVKGIMSKVKKEKPSL